MKNYDQFITVVAAVKKLLPGIKAEIVGKGPGQKILNDIIIKNDLQNNIRMTGELPYDAVLDRMQRTKIFLHPSSAEGFSGVCMEALYAGAHVVSFCKPMNNDIEKWHITPSVEEMVSQTNKILGNLPGDYNRVLLYSIDETAATFSALFF